jgi:hypothetical protein
MPIDNRTFLTPLSASAAAREASHKPNPNCDGLIGM